MIDEFGFVKEDIIKKSVEDIDKDLRTHIDNDYLRNLLFIGLKNTRSSAIAKYLAYLV